MPSPTYEEALAALESRLTRKATVHSVSVGEEAARLAAIYGIDEQAARMAGLLHDWSRDAGGTALRESAERRGIPVTPVDEAVPYLLHAAVGAAELKEAFPGLDDAIVRAVERHTVGARDMTPLDMVVYLADMIEPGRSFEGVDHLRELVGTMPLEQLFAEAYAASIRHLVARHKRLHPATVQTWNSIVARESR